MRESIAKINRPGNITASIVSDHQTSFVSTTSVVYAVLCIAMAALISFLFGSVIIPGTTDVRSAAAPASCFTFLGIIFTAFFCSKPFLNKPNDSSSVTYAFVVFTGIFAVLVLIDFIKSRSSVITNLFYSSLFLLPYAICQAWLFYNRLLFISSHRKIWYLPEEASDMPKVTVFLNSITIQIKMAPGYNAPEQAYETTVPGRLSVGMMFTHFIKNRDEHHGQNETFEDIDNQLFGWQFSVPAFWGIGERLVDANESLDKNKIKNGMVVSAKRIPKQTATLQSIH